jgi:murein DD-endopeptidase MepM/ murein hydrolase activator NlpD
MNVVAIVTSLLIVLTPASTQWQSPVLGDMHVMRVFSLPNGQYQPGHRGVDIRAEPGDLVFSPVSASVHFVGHIVDRDVLTLAIEPNLLLSFEPVTSSLIIGERVQVGQLIGEVSTSGHCTPSCMHLGVRDVGRPVSGAPHHADGNYRNPLRYFAGMRPRLLPLGGPASVNGGAGLS